MSKDKKVIAYKGFDKNMKCRGFQFEVGAMYKHDGDVKACSSGFHSCTNPWDVLSYYDITSRFAYVEISGKTSTHEDDSKIASSEITIKAEIKLPKFITDCINYLKDICRSEVDITDASSLAASGYSSRLAASGNASSLAASGYSSSLAASGNASSLAASGNASSLAASGNDSRLAASGNDSRLAASGYSSRLAASGNASSLAASGYSSSLAASGNASRLAASGYSSRLAASGYSSRLAASGNDSIVCCAGVNSKSKIGIHGAMSLSRWVESEQRYRISVAYEGENGIKPDTWYRLNDDGEFIEVTED